MLKALIDDGVEDRDPLAELLAYPRRADEPLSLAASIIAVATVAAQITSTISKLRVLCELPGRLHALSNEVTDLQVVLRHVSSTVDDATARPDHQKETIRRLLQQAKSKLEELNVIVQRLTVSCAGGGKFVVRAATWWKEKPRLQALQEDLHGVKANLNIILGVSHSNDMMRVELDLRRVSVVTSKISQNQASLHENVIQSLSHRQQCFDQTLQQNQDYVDQRLNGLEQMLLEQFARLQTDQTSWRGNNFPEVPIQRHKQSTQDYRAELNERADKSSTRLEGICIRTAQYKDVICRPRCSCACHLSSEFESPGFMGRVLGKLFLGYAGMPLINRRCDVGSCARRQTPYVNMEYWFPMWFLSHIIRLQVAYQPTVGPRIEISTLRRVPDGAQCIAFALEGNIDGLKDLFVRGLASPQDVDYGRGWGILRWALYQSQYETCKFLIAVGADPDYNSTSDKVWDHVLQGHLSEKEQETVKRLLDSSDFVDEQMFPLVHKIVLGMSLRCLEEHLIDDTDAIHAVDIQKRTALFWAAARGDERSTVALLAHGADPNAMDKNGATPLYLAAGEGRTGCIRLLLEAGAQTEPKLPPGIGRSTPLICAAMNAPDPLATKTILDFNANINACNPEGMTALHQVARCNTANHALLLLEHNADLNIRSNDGKTPLTVAITYNNHDVLQLLLDRWFQFSECPRLQIPHFLDVVAEYADLRTISIIASADHLKLNQDNRYNLGKAAAEKLRQRSGSSEKLTLAFEELLGLIQKGERRDTDLERLMESGLLIPGGLDWERIDREQEGGSDSDETGESFADAKESFELLI